MTSKEALDKILQSPITKAAGGCFMKNDELETIKQDLDRLEKLEKAIDIIKTKKINIHLFISLLSRKYPYKGISGFLFNCLRDEYNHITLKHFGTSLDNLLTEEESEILKEVLEDGRV